MKKLAKSILPPILISLYRGKKFPWKGDYPTWQAALDECSGYDSQEIVNRVAESAFQVASGQYPYERDASVFDKVSYSWPLSTALLYTAQKYKTLRVLDFGGGMGSSYFQNRAFLEVIPDLKWFIVEQEMFIKTAQALAGDRLLFRESLKSVQLESEINFVLLSSVLQYLENPYSVIEDVLGLKPKVILIDRMSTVDYSEDIITKQTVNESMYSASYPCRFFNEANILSKFKADYRLVSSFESFVANEGLLNLKYHVKEMGYFFMRN